MAEVDPNFDETTRQDAFARRLMRALESSVRGGPAITDAHLKVVEKDFLLDETKTAVHCYAPALDAHGRLKPRALAEFLFDRIVDYAIPRHLIEEASAEQQATGSTASLNQIVRQARRLFTHLENGGEGGELLLFTLAERVFGLAQILCKMSIKSSTSMHYHGADGVYAEAGPDGGLNVYWGESKLYAKPSDAIRDCLASLAPFLREEFGDDATRAQDIFLINEYGALSDPEAAVALKRFFRSDSAEANKLRLCGFALVGFDVEHFPQKEESGVWADINKALTESLPGWRKQASSRLAAEKLDAFDIHLVLMPLRSVEEFRAEFLGLIKGN